MHIANMTLLSIAHENFIDFMNQKICSTFTVATMKQVHKNSHFVRTNESFHVVNSPAHHFISAVLFDVPNFGFLFQNATCFMHAEAGDLLYSRMSTHD